MSYKSFDFNLPTRIVFGPNESERAAVYVAEFAPKRVMILTYADILLPVVKKLMKDLEEAGIAYELYDRCLANPKAGQIDAAAAFCVEKGCDIVLGVGGGSVIDTTKGTALLAANPTPGGIWDYVSGVKTPERRALPILLVVTIASTGSECNESFVVTDEADTQKLICNEPSVRSTLSICDPVLSVTLPARQTALGAIDAFSHVMEQYLHGDSNVELSDNLCIGAMAAILKWAPVAVKEPGDLDARSNLLWASILAMSRVLGVGHDENWICHMLEHAVSAAYAIPHAAGMAALMPTYFAWLKEKGLAAERLQALAALFGSEDAAKGLAEYQHALGLPASLKELLGKGADAETIRRMAENALPWGPTEHAGFGMFTIEDAEEIFRRAFE